MSLSDFIVKAKALGLAFLSSDAASVAVPSAMAALSIDITKIDNTKNATSGDTYTWSAAPSSSAAPGQTWGLKLSNTTTSAFTVTIPNCWFANALAIINTVVVPAADGSGNNGSTDLIFRWDAENSRVNVYGALVSLDNYIATTDPGTGNDVTQGYSAGSIWLNTATRKIFVCLSNSTNQAQWNQSSQHLGSGTWANRPTTVADGDTYFVTDVGYGVLHVYRTKNIFGAGNVTRFWPVGDFTLGDSGYVNGTASASEQIITATTFPAGYAWVGMCFTTDVQYSKVSGTADASTHLTFRAGLHLGTTADHSLNNVFDATNKVTAALNECAYTIEWQIASTTTISKKGSGGGGNPSWAGTAGSQASAQTIDTIANAWGIGLSMTMAGSTDTPKGSMRIRIKAD